MEKDSKVSYREPTTAFSVQTQSKGVWAVCLFWIAIHAVMMERAFGAHMQTKESDYMDITSAQKDLSKRVHESKQSNDLSSSTSGVNGVCNTAWLNKTSPGWLVEFFLSVCLDCGAFYMLSGSQTTALPSG